MPTLPRISTLARDNLIAHATQYQYIRPPRNPKTLPYATMQQYLNALSLCNFQDTRPPDIIALDETLDEANLPRIWYANNTSGANPDNAAILTKLKWHIQIPTTTQARFIQIAEHYYITPMRPHRPPTTLTRVMCVLEAIGQSNLTPIDLPIAHHKYPVRYDPTYPSRSWPSIAVYPAGGSPQ